MRTIELSAGTIEYEDTRGSGPIVVLLHGLAMDGSLWRHVVQVLRDDFRCIVPTLPFGGHRISLRAYADLSPHGIARLQAEFLGQLDLHEVTLVGTDSGIFLIVASAYPERIARLAIISCSVFENYPPGLPGRMVALAAGLPGGLNALAQPICLRALRRLPIALGLMTKRAIPDEITDAWLHPLLTQPEIRRDLGKYARLAKKGVMLTATENLRSFDRPTLVVWAKQDRVMPPEHGRRLVELLPDGRLIEIDDSYTLIPEDQPDELARAIRQFIRDTP
jgi:pimeloyl-ACP methyl ester carboxylesterase